MLPEQQQRILGYFIEEAKDHLNTIEQGLLNLQATIGNPEMANEMFRAAHSVKGGAAMLGIESMQRTAHRMEDYFKVLKESPIQVDRPLESMFLRVFDALQELLEQLQGPFGLTEDKEQSVMAGVEPVFQELQQHLDQLVSTTGTSEVLDQTTAPAPYTPPSLQPVEESALKLVFSSDVSATLRNMLTRFKQADTGESRSALEGYCQLLEQFGEQFSLPAWVNLVTQARWAVCDRNNDYRTLAPVLIKEIKKAQDLVLSGRQSAIVVADTLQALVPAESQTDVLDTTSDFDALFTDSEPDEHALAGDELSELEPDSPLSDSDMLSSPLADDGLSLDNLLADAAASPSGPEVGAAELTSLADLFEVGGDALNSDWQEEDIPISDVTPPAESLDIDIASDFEDLLGDSSLELDDSPNDFESGSELADLFDDAGSDATPDSPDELDSGLEELSQIGLSADDTDALLSENLDSIDGLFDDVATSDLSTDADDLFSDLNMESEAADTSNGTLEGSELSDLDASAPSTDASDLFSALSIEPEAADTSNSTLESPELSGLDELDDFALTDPNVDGPEEIDLDIETAVGEQDDIALPQDNSDGTPESNSADLPTDSFFEAVEASVTDEESIDTEPKLAEVSEIDSFFTLDDTTSAGSEALEPSIDDLWETDTSPANLTAPTLEPEASDDLSSDIWADSSLDNGPETIRPESDLSLDIADLGESNLELEEATLGESNLGEAETASNQAVAEELSDLELDDMWASTEDVTSVDSPGIDEQSEPSQFSSAQEVDDLFGNSRETEDIEIASELELSNNDASLSLDNGLEDLFGENTAPDSELGNLFGSSDSLEETATASEVTGLEGLENLELEETDFSSLDAIGADVDNSSGDKLNESDSSREGLEFLNEPPSDDIEFDLLDLEDGGIVTGFVTEDQALQSDPTMDPETTLDELLGQASSDTAGAPHNDLSIENLDFDNTDIDFLDAGANDLPQSPSSPDPTDVDIIDTALEDSDLSLGEPFVGAEFIPSDDSSNGLLETAETADSPEVFSETALDDLAELDDLLSEPLEGNQATAPDGSNDEFGDLEALLQDTDEATTPEQETASGLDMDDEFGDLEALLQDADQTLAATSSNPATYRPKNKASRLSGRRMVTDQTMRVSVGHLDNLSNLVGELVVNRNTLEQDQERLRQFLDNLLFQVQQLNDVGQRMRDLYERSLLESSLISSRQSYQMASASTAETTKSGDHATGEFFDALEMDRFTGFHTLSQEMIELIVRVRESASDIAYTVESSDQVTRQFRQVTNQLQEGLNKARMVPFAQAASRLPRAVRDISFKCGKEARLVVEGRDILIDKMILEQLYDPMTHLVNNAITHGVETPEERQAAGKMPEGVITVRAFYQGNQTVISVGDDGAGIDADMVKQKALQKGLISQADVQTMTVLDVYDLLFHPGFSTRDQADDFAGRGFGMDVVRTSLADIRGNITIDSELGRGTNFTIRLPLTLSISKALSCISNQARIAFPMDGVEDMFDVSRERIQENNQGQDCILWRDTLLPFQNLSDLLSFNRTLGRGRVYGGNQDENMISIVVLRSANSFIALEVDQVMGEQEIVIKQLEGPVPKPTGIAGATVLGDGRVMPIADVLELIDLAMGRVRRDLSAAVWAQMEEAPPEETAQVKSEPTVLIVDDSITVRELLSMSFNKVGYRVEQARDGQEAWEKLRSGLPCDLVFCDIEMPRMDGLELLSRLQKDEGLQQIPIAMLTSRGADRHRQMAVDLGASGYFTKPYLEEALLDAANKMLHGEKLV
ncbi:MAG: response regulator [Cyanobacteria bacterium P01_H01_bin.26]